MNPDSLPASAAQAVPAYHGLAALDYAIIAVYLVLSLAIGIMLSRRSRRSLADFFASGGKIPWYLLGVSMVATSFAADTPLALSGMVYSQGVSGNWFWWCSVPMTLAGVFFFARLWKRANLVTDNEFVYLRYSGRPAHVLRGFRAVYFALIYASIVLGWVNLAMVKIVGGLLEPHSFAMPAIDRPIEATLRATGFIGEARAIAVGTQHDGGPRWRLEWVQYMKGGGSFLAQREGEVESEVIIPPGSTIAEAVEEIRKIRGLDARLITVYVTGTEPASRVRAFTHDGPLPQLATRQLGARGDKPGVVALASGVALLADTKSPDEVAGQVLTFKILLLCFLMTISYCAISGLWGVVVTDFIQFFIAMGGSLWLAYVAVSHFGGLDGLLASLRETFGVARADAMLTMLPLHSKAELDAAMRAAPGAVAATGGLTLMTFSRWLVFVVVVWYALGFTDGGSYLAQRMIAAKSERDAATGYLLYGVVHYCLRMWPWILVGMAGACLFPTLAHQQAVQPGLATYDPELNYIFTMRQFLGVGGMGLLVASFLAAYMSTVSSHVNLAAGYLVNDLYKPFIRRDATEKHYVFMSTVATVLVAAVGIVFTLFMSSIVQAWFLLGSLNAGIGLVYILRWYWWRVSAWSELSCFAAVMCVTVVLTLGQWGATYERGLAAGANPSAPQRAVYEFLDRNPRAASAVEALARALVVTETSHALVPLAEGEPRDEAAADAYARATGESVPAGHNVVIATTRFSLADFPYNYLLLVPLSLLVWLTATFLTPPVEREKLRAFYRRVRPGGPGWRAIAAECPEVPAADSVLNRRNFAAWGLSVAAVYCALFGFAQLLLGSAAMGGVLLVAAAAFGALLSRHFSAARWEETTATTTPSAPAASADETAGSS